MLLVWGRIDWVGSFGLERKGGGEGLDWLELI